MKLKFIEGKFVIHIYAALNFAYIFKFFIIIELILTAPIF